MTADRPTTWKGHSLTVLHANQEVRFELWQKLRDITASMNAQMAEAGLRMNEELGRMLDINPEAVHWGAWECSGSPTGSCIYDNHADPGHDDCLICGDPSDRG